MRLLVPLFFTNNGTGSCDVSNVDLTARVFWGLKLSYSVAQSSAAAAAAVCREAPALLRCAPVLTETFVAQVCARGFTALLRSERVPFGCSDEKE